MGLSTNLEALPAGELISWALTAYGNEFAIATSFQKEGMVIVDLAHRAGAPLPCRVFTLDTGRLPEETYRIMETVRQRYGIRIEVVAPEPADLEPMIAEHGPDLFYRSRELRALCCEIRKVRPLQRKLASLQAWATGLRRGQSAMRSGVRKAEQVDGRLRLCPLADWSAEEVDAYIARHEVPLHPLYRCGYTSIGCAPCTRAVSPGEDERAGRWWWETQSSKECGIHFAADGTVQRGA